MKTDHASIASAIIHAVDNSPDLRLADVTGIDRELAHAPGPQHRAHFDVYNDNETSSGKPARKVWRVTVELIEDSTIDD